MYGIFSTPRYEALGAFYRIEIPLFIAEINAQRWRAGIKAIVLIQTHQILLSLQWKKILSFTQDFKPTQPKHYKSTIT